MRAYHFSDVVVARRTREVERASSASDTLLAGGLEGSKATHELNVEDCTHPNPSDQTLGKLKLSPRSRRGEKDLQGPMMDWTSLAVEPMMPNEVRFLNVVPEGQRQGRSSIVHSGSDLVSVVGVEGAANASAATAAKLARRVNCIFTVVVVVVVVLVD